MNKNLVKLSLFIVIFTLSISSVYAATIRGSLKNKLGNFVNYICYETPMTGGYFSCILKYLDHPNSFNSVTTGGNNSGTINPGVSSPDFQNLSSNTSLSSTNPKYYTSNDPGLMKGNWWYNTNILVTDIPFYIGSRDWIGCINPYNRNGHGYRSCRYISNSFPFPRGKTLSLRFLSKNVLSDNAYSEVRIRGNVGGGVKGSFLYSISKTPGDFSSGAINVFKSDDIYIFSNPEKNNLPLYGILSKIFHQNGIIEPNTVYYFNIIQYNNIGLAFHSNPSIQLSGSGGSNSGTVFYVPTELPSVYGYSFFDYDKSLTSPGPSSIIYGSNNSNPPTNPNPPPPTSPTLPSYGSCSFTGSKLFYFKNSGGACINANFACNNGNLNWWTQASPAPSQPSPGVTLYENSSCDSSQPANTSPTQPNPSSTSACDGTNAVINPACN